MYHSALSLSPNSFKQSFHMLLWVNYLRLQAPAPTAHQILFLLSNYKYPKAYRYWCRSFLPASSCRKESWSRLWTEILFFPYTVWYSLSADSMVGVVKIIARVFFIVAHNHVTRGWFEGTRQTINISLLSNISTSIVHDRRIGFQLTRRH